MSKDFPWIASLEDLRHFDNLQHLSLSDSGNTSGGIFTTRPLDLSGSVVAMESDLYDGLDYEPLTRIPSLVLLDLTNHRNLDTELGNTIVSGSPELRYFIIAYTPAARNMERPEQLIYFGNNR